MTEELFGCIKSAMARHEYLFLSSSQMVLNSEDVANPQQDVDRAYARMQTAIALERIATPVTRDRQALAGTGFTLGDPVLQGLWLGEHFIIDHVKTVLNVGEVTVARQRLSVVGITEEVVKRVVRRLNLNPTLLKVPDHRADTRFGGHFDYFNTAGLRAKLPFRTHPFLDRLQRVVSTSSSQVAVNL